MKKRIRVHVSGRVQGVGFRPTVFRYATAHALSGFVRNTPSGVVVEAQGEEDAIAGFVDQLKRNPPSQSRIEALDIEELPVSSAVPAQGKDADAGPFEIISSSRSGDLRAGMPPDLATCQECRAELFDPANRRYRYPFINCTNCGPRFSIIRELPYDRKRTSMATFALCPQCQVEYGDPLNRRFDAQPNACPVCGPKAKLITPEGACAADTGQIDAKGLLRASPDALAALRANESRPPSRRPHASRVAPSIDAIEEYGGRHSHAAASDPFHAAAQHLRDGAIVAVKGIGGYHLCCDATSDQAIARLRERKNRPGKSLAVMFACLEDVRRHAEVSDIEAEELSGCAGPIVVVRRRPALEAGKPGSCLSRLVSPDTDDIGAFLPYSPVHHILLGEIGPLVMTSGNVAEEPIAKDEEGLKRLLGPIADAALVHNRPIVRRCDDSVLKVVEGERLVLRRSRGLVPNPVQLPFEGPPVLACGAELKSTVCVTRGDQAFVSPHIGDLDDYRAYQFFCETIRDFSELLRVRPEIVAHDAHPDYPSTRYALGSGPGPRVAVQHHHAHIAACMTEHGVTEPVIGVALDGTGFGPDGTVWGGEFLVADLKTWRRVAHFKQYRMPGGEQAIRNPVRMALSYLLTDLDSCSDPLAHALLPSLSNDEWSALPRMIERGIRSPLTSSAGRLFDAVAVLLGIDEPISYEGQAAIRLQTLACRDVASSYAFDVGQIGAKGLLRASPDALAALRANESRPLSRRPHASRVAPSMDAIKGYGGRHSHAATAMERQEKLMTISFGPMIRSIIAEIQAKVDRGVIAGKFHNTVADAVAKTCSMIRKSESLDRVALSGGVFQNDLLLDRARKLLIRDGFHVYTHHQVPPNDGGISLGQAAVALARGDKNDE